MNIAPQLCTSQFQPRPAPTRAIPREFDFQKNNSQMPLQAVNVKCEMPLPGQAEITVKCPAKEEILLQSSDLFLCIA